MRRKNLNRYTSRESIFNDDPRQLTIEFDIPDAPPVVPSHMPGVKDSAPVGPERLLYYLSIGSGSSGNCSYLGTRSGGIIIDAGIRNDEVEQTLAANGIRMDKIRGILITHDHTDHIKYAYNLLRNNRHLKLYCTPRVLNGILRRHSISRRIKEYHVPIYKEIPFKIADFEITAFDVPHDGSDNMGFSVEFDQRRFVLATDIGKVTERAYHYMSQANYLVIEANYDDRMLTFGPYPEYLKARIRTDHGHLDNRDTASFLSETVTEELKYVFLCHLSQENNTPDIALKTVRDALTAKGITVGDGRETILDRQCQLQLSALPRKEPSNLYIFRPHK